MTSARQIEANRRNARKSTGPTSAEGKQRSRCNAVRHGLTAETVIRALENAEDYRAFEAAVTADYDAQSAVERELVLRLASLLWRLRRATAMETGLFEIQAENLREFRRARRVPARSRELASAMFSRRQRGSFDDDAPSNESAHGAATLCLGGATFPADFVESPTEIAKCFLRLANLPSAALDRLNRYEAALWRQVGQILFTLEALERRKPRERRHLSVEGLFRRICPTGHGPSGS
jgi:hypothetical protein